MRNSSIAALAFVLGAPGWAGAFEARISNPDITVVIPGLPEMATQSRAPGDRAPNVRLTGDDGTYTLSIAAPAARAGTSARECAGSVVRTLLSGPQALRREHIYRAQLTETTFLAIYVKARDGASQWHAHLVSSARGQHCIEVHVSRRALATADADAWLKTFEGARIEERAK